MRYLLIIISLVLLTASPAYSVEPPHLTEKLLKNADEHAVIEVIDVKTKDFDEKPYIYKAVNVKARIISVTKTGNALSPGMIIFIVYAHQYKADKNGTPVPGPSIIPVLQTGQRLDAFLNRQKQVRHSEMLLNVSDSDLIFSPAALGNSFRKREH